LQTTFRRKNLGSVYEEEQSVEKVFQRGIDRFFKKGFEGGRRLPYRKKLGETQKARGKGRNCKENNEPGGRKGTRAVSFKSRKKRRRGDRGGVGNRQTKTVKSRG